MGDCSNPTQAGNPYESAISAGKEPFDKTFLENLDVSHSLSMNFSGLNYNVSSLIIDEPLMPTDQILSIFRNQIAAGGSMDRLELCRLTLRRRLLRVKANLIVFWVGPDIEKGSSHLWEPARTHPRKSNRTLPTISIRSWHPILQWRRLTRPSPARNHDRDCLEHTRQGAMCILEPQSACFLNELRLHFHLRIQD